MQHELYTRAKHWLKAGADLVPIRSDSKALIKGYGANSKHVTTEASAWYWWAKTGVNLGVVCGGALGLAVLDFDQVELFDAWRFEVGPVDTYTERTGRGYHVFFQAEGLPNILSKGLELKTSGVVMVAPSMHPSGKRYEIVSDAPVARLTPDGAKLLLPFVSDLLQQPTVEPPPSPRRPLKEPGGRDVVSRIKAARLISDEARQLTTLVGKGGHYYGKCPFHEDKQPSFWVDDVAGLWGCYSPACSTNEKGKAHDLINLRAFAQDISVREAIQELARELLPPLPVHQRASASTQSR